MSMINVFIQRTDQTQSSKDKDLSHTDIKYLCAHMEKKHEILTCTTYAQNPNQKYYQKDYMQSDRIIMH